MLAAVSIGAPALLETATHAAGAGATATGPQWAFLIDLRRCDGCDHCTTACQSAHYLSEEQTWIKVYKLTNAAGLTLAMPRLCMHCENPPCVRVCPTQATWKREDGIVMMDWHRCIGCRYCMAGCPYGSRSFNWSDPRPAIRTITPDFPTRSKGVVEKCTFCEERLAKNQMPACVEACPDKAIVFGDVRDPGSEVRALLRSRLALRRKAELGTGPAVYYIV